MRVTLAVSQGTPISVFALLERYRELLAANFEGWMSAVESCFIEAGDRLGAGSAAGHVRAVIAR